MAEKIDYGEVMIRMKSDVDYIAEEAYNKGYEQAKLIWSGKTNEESYQRGLSEGHDIGYKKGLEDGKKAFDLLDAERDSEYQRGLSEGNDIGYKDGVKDGQNEAWECAKKLFSTMSETEIEKVFPAEWENGFYGLMQMKPQYAIAKLKAYEEKQKADEDVKRGDVVRHKVNGLTYIVTLAGDCGYVLLGGDGNFATSCITNSFEKTGKHVDIDKILEGLRYDS